jgi:hypothetical protein
MTKIFIVEFDLGTPVEEIISEEVEAITGEARKILDKAIEHQKTLQEVKQQKQKQKKDEKDNISKIMINAYKLLEEAKEEGVPVKTIMHEAKPIIPNSSAFTLRMKNILKENGNPYILQRKQRNKIPHYIFEPFNKEE